jgi:hypothetical protein
MTSRQILVATHGHCFDGMASAALFTHLRQAIEPAAELEVRYRSCGYGPGMSAIPEAWLDGDENAILDFRYTGSKRLTWFFDHHVTGFGSAEERAAAEASATKVFYDATYGSCTQLIADVARDKYGVTSPELAELIRWADVIDAARFDSAEAATNRSEPVLQLASVVEHHGDAAFLTGIIPRLLQRGVDEVAREAPIQLLWKPLAAAQQTYVDRVKRGATVMGNVVLIDLSDAPLDAAGKFVSYALHPESIYSVTLIRTKQHAKVSVGYNPWSGKPRTHDIAAICRRYGGGGHPVVGACAFPLAQLAAAREAAHVIAIELDG